jgi:hypothetical protein
VAQGFVFTKALPAADVVEWLRSDGAAWAAWEQATPLRPASSTRAA